MSGKGKLTSNANKQIKEHVPDQTSSSQKVQVFHLILFVHLEMLQSVLYTTRSRHVKRNFFLKIIYAYRLHAISVSQVEYKLIKPP